MKINTTTTFKTTKTLFTLADSCVPLIHKSDNQQTMIMAGTFIITHSKGPFKNAMAISRLKILSSSLKYCDQHTATVADANAYSKTRSQPVIQAMNSPIVA